jgi:iron(III) transport system permease protein
VVRALARRQQEVALGAAALVLSGVALVPLVAPLAELAAAPGEVARSLGEPRAWTLLLRSLALAALVTLVAASIGVPLGALLGRANVAGRRLAWLIHAFPMFLPPLLPALGWFHLFGRAGLAGSATSAGILFSPIGGIGVLGLAFAPVVTTLTALSLLGVDASLEEAARVVARPWRVVTRVLLPSASPAIALAAIIVFCLALSELGVPMFLRVDVYQAAVFARLGGIDYAPGEALGLSLPLLPIALALVLLERRAAGQRSFAVIGLRGGARAPLSLGRARAPVSAACWAAALVSASPIAALAVAAARGGGFTALPAWIGASPWTSLATAALAATLITALGLVLGHAVARRARGAAALDAAAMMAFVTPAPILGGGLIAIWNRPATQAVYGSLAILVLGAASRYAVVGLRAMAVTVAQSSPHLEEAAAAARIVLPLHARGALAAWLLALTFALRDLEMAVSFYPPGQEPLTVRIFTLEANGPQAVVAALAVAHTAMTAAVLAAGAWLLARTRRP